ncbi:MAG: amino acid adenylation domain-containing protein [Candidatus Aminicenantes bacterium]|jgi:amino acid adenylation domain-containing protein
MEKLDKKNIEDILALTPMQEGMLFHYLKYPENEHYFEQLSLEISGQIDKEHFEKAWNFVTETNEMLRTVFRWEKVDKPAQVVLKQHNPEVRFFDLSAIENHVEQQKQLEKIKLQDRKAKFNLREVPFRIILCKLSDKDYHIIISNHHILYDGWSNGIILKEFFKAHHELCKGKPSKSPSIKPKPPFKEFIKWMQNHDRNKQEQFWREYLDGFDTPTVLPVKRRRDRDKVKRVDSYSLIMEKDIKNKLDIFVTINRVTLASVLYCAWGIVLQKYCSSDDVIFGTIVAGRSTRIKGIEDMVGLFINTIPLRVQVYPKEKISTLLFRIDRILHEREEFENTPLVDIRSYSGVEGSGSLFDVIVAMENYPLDSGLLPGDSLLSVHSYSLLEMTQYDLTVGILLFNDNEIEVKFSYHRELFDKETISHLARHFKGIVQNVVENPEEEVYQLEIISREEKNRILYDLNHTEAQFPGDKTLHQLFAEQVERTPNHVALIGKEEGGKGIKVEGKKEGMHLSYRELNQRSNQLAQLLKEKDVKTDTIVGIKIGRSVEMIVGILGILKASGAYMPIDPEYPEERIDFMLGDSNATILLTRQEIAGLSSPQVLNNRPKGASSHLHLSPAPVTSLAYIIYTSGTTGKPKGCLVEHRNVVRLLKNSKFQFDFHHRDVWTLFHSYCFDFSVWEMYGALLYGGKLILIPRLTARDPGLYLEVLKNQGVTILNQTPSAFYNLSAEEIKQKKKQLILRYVIFGGEALQPGRLREWRQRYPHTRLVNMFGITETTVHVTFRKIDETDIRFNISNIGRPIPTLSLFVLGEDLRLLPLGVPGELYVGGDGVARGYLNRPELTCEKFDHDLWDYRDYHNEEEPFGQIKNAFGEEKAHEFPEKNNQKFLRGGPGGALFSKSAPPGRRRQKIYKTGDLVRRWHNGEMEYLGRLDRQVQLRGFRVELGEIEHQLLKHHQVKETVVLAKEDKTGDKYLVAYCVSDMEPSVSELREHLFNVLPDYMIPSNFVFLKKIPLTTNRKIDRKALTETPLPEFKPLKNYVSPRNSIEEKLVELWCEVLGRNALNAVVGIDDNFFQVGGHSLKATSLVSRIHKAFHVKVPLREIFKRPTIRGLYDYIKDAVKEQYLWLESVEEREYYLLSSAQKRLYVLQQMDKGETTYNISSAWILTGSVDGNMLEPPFKKLIQRHESLRTSFRMIEEEPVQRTHDEVEFKIEYYETGKRQKAKGNKQELMPNAYCLMPESIIKDFIRPFDLSQAPLLRIGLAKLPYTPPDLRRHPRRGTYNSQEGRENKYLLMVDMHHIISDGISANILMGDFMALYSGAKLPALRIHYKDYCIWQKHWKRKQSIIQQQEYWLKEFKGNFPVLNLPTDYTRPSVQSFEGSTVRFALGIEHAPILKKLAREEDTTLYMVLLSIFNILISKISGQEDIIIGTPVAGRRDPDLKQVVGMFVNTLALRNYPIGKKTFKEFLNEVKENTLQAFENQDYPFEDLVEKIVEGRDARRNPLFDVMFTLQLIENSQIEMPGLKIKSYDYENKKSKFDLTLSGEEVGAELVFTFEYCTNLFKRETIEKFVKYLKKIVSSLPGDLTGKLEEIEIIADEEKKQILYEFNDTEGEFPKHQVIHELFEEQVKKNRHHTAVVFSDKKLTYRELNRRANQLARMLREKGVKPDNIVGIITHPSLEMIVGLMAILKSGGAYLPVNPNFPAERKKYLVCESTIRWALLQKYLPGENKEILQDLPGDHIICIDDESAYTGNSSNLKPVNQLDDLAYVLYTSGTTGRPKGVMAKQRSVINVVSWFAKTYSLRNGGNRALQLTDYTFDPSVEDIFGSLLHGSILYVADKELVFDRERFCKFVQENQINIVNYVPSILNDLLCHDQKLDSLQVVISGGEKLQNSVKNRIIDKGYLLYNHYGPTEITVDVLTAWCTGDQVTLGRPLSNMRCYILDFNEVHHFVPIGIVGELYISGVGVARGYLNCPELTNEKFVPNPFEKCQWTERMYCTGDLARWLPGGDVEFLGRKDDQVKIRGYRIELDEIEMQLLNHSEIDEASVIAKESFSRNGSYESGEQLICAYIVSGKDFQAAELREYLQKKLPGYMIPSCFFQVDHLPRVSNGKVDRKALDFIGKRLGTGVEYAAPGDDIEKMVAEIWMDILNSEKVGIHDNFFDIGGNSMHILRVNSKLKEAFKRDIPVVIMFRYPTIGSLAEYLRQGETGKASSTGSVKERGEADKRDKIGLSEIAVIGMAGRFPGAINLDEFWNNLKNGRESISFFSTGELEESGISPGLLTQPGYIKAKGILEDIEYFDSSLFQYSPSEAGKMDLQIRAFHECVWEALNHAGYDPGSYGGLIGIYAGVIPNFQWIFDFELGNKNPSELYEFSNLNDTSSLSTRISYKLNLKGPAITIQTACSTSLVAVDVAIQGLLSGKCDMALAGGVSIVHPQKSGYLYQEGMIMSPDGHCRPFDAEAKGTVPGDGVGVVVLKRLDRAIQEGDYIQAVVKGSAVNNDGNQKTGYTSPSIQGQVQVIRQAHQNAGVAPESITYVETHGTGTKIGDPIEIESLKIAFNTNKRNICALGSVKANIGHLDVAAGIAGFIKVVLALKHHLIPPGVNFKTVNPEIDFNNSPFYVNITPIRWKQEKHPLRAGVSSFGIGGTNAHVILEEAPGPNQEEDLISKRKTQLLLLSARTAASLEQTTKNLVEYIKKEPRIDLADIAYTLQVGRKVFEYRKMAVCSNHNEAIDMLTSSGDLSSSGAKGFHTVYVKEEERPVIFMFPGQGSQYVEMGLDLYRNEPEFRKELDRCFGILNNLLDYDIKEALYPSSRFNRSDRSYTSDKPYMPNINQTGIAQPLLFAFEYALARLLIRRGIKPDAMIGHSIGEFVAAYFSGVFSLQDALSLVVQRGKLMQALPPGAMLSISISEHQLKPLLGNDLSLAAINGPFHCVVSGSSQVLDAFAGKMKKKGYESRYLHTSHAFHSKMMDPILEEFEKKVSEVTVNKPKIPYISNVTGKWISTEDAADPVYWAKQLRQTVRFADGLEEILNKENSILVEVGPGNTLSTLVRRYREQKEKPIVVNLIRHPKENIPDMSYFLNRIGQLWLYGIKIDWSGFYGEEKRQRIPLPPYVFEGRRYPLTLKRKSLKTGGEKIAANRLTGKRDITDWCYIPSWKRISLSTPQWEQMPPSSCWLVFVDSYGLGIPMVKQLEKANQVVIVVKAGLKFVKESHLKYTVNPQQDIDYDFLFKELAASGMLPHRIIHLWSVTSKDKNGSPMAWVDKAQDFGFYSLVNIAQSIGKQSTFGHLKKIQIAVVSNNMQEVTGEEWLCPEKATLLGPVKTIPREYENIHCFSVDIVLPEETESWKKKEVSQIIDQLLMEFTDVKGTAETVRAYRGNYRWVQYFEPIRLSEPGEKIMPLREKGVYLITGGLGGIGLTLARYLAKEWQARLVLTGRSALPGKEKWEEWLTNRGGTDKTSLKIQKVRELEKLGAETLVLKADVANLQQMQSVVTRVKQHFGRIDGVIHSAGVPDGAVIQRRSREMTEPVLAPKVRGTLVLDTVLQDVDLDFFILCSSLSSVFAPYGQVGYCAANAFLDAFACHRSFYQKVRKKRSPISINWDMWQKVGMAVEALQQSKKTRDLRHPLFHQYMVEPPGKEVYVSYLSTKNSWILDEHRIKGKAMLPGTAYLEMVRAAFAPHSLNRSIQINEAYFFKPLLVSDDEEKEIRTILEKQGETAEFIIMSRVPAEKSSSKGAWQEHARGNVSLLGEEPPRKHDIEKIKKMFKQEPKDLNIEESDTPIGLLEFGPRWNNIKEARYGIDEAIIQLELPSAFIDDLNIYKLHPAMLDSATSFLVQKFEEAEIHAPFCFKNLKLRGPLSQIVYSYIKYSANDNPGNNSLEFNITIMDEEGTELVTIEKFILLKVFDQKIANSLEQGEDRVVQMDFLDDGILPEEGLEVFLRILSGTIPQVLVSTKDLMVLAEENNQWQNPVDVVEEETSSITLSQRPELSTRYVPPKNETEQKLVDILKKSFGIEKVGTRDDFFELGGDSLGIVTISTRIQKEFNVDIQMSEFFSMPTIAGLAQYILQAKKGTFSLISPVEKKEYYPVSAAQKRLYILNLLDSSSTNYNLPGGLIIEGKLDKIKVENAIKRLIKRQASLRTSFNFITDEPVQIVHEEVEFKVNHGEAGEEQAQTMVKKFVKPFDLKKAPILRMEILNLSPDKHVFMFDIHHITADAMGCLILIEEFFKLYNDVHLPALNIQYKDFALWQNKLIKGGKLDRQKEYWVNQFKGFIPVLNLPTDFPRPKVQSFDGNTVLITMDKELTSKTKQLAINHEVTLYMVILTAFYIILHKYSGQEDVVINTAALGRPYEDLRSIIGMFVNSLPIRNYPQKNKSLDAFLAEVKKRALQAYENQDYQFDELVEHLDIERDISRNPLADVGFSFMSFGTSLAGISELSGGTLKLEPYEVGIKISSKADITLFCTETEEELIFNFEYCSRLFKPGTMKRFARGFLTVIAGIIDNPQEELAQIQIISGAEKNQLLIDFNNTGMEYPQDKNIHRLFEEQVGKTPDNIALIYKDRYLSYSELDKRANQLGWLAKTKGVKRNRIVGIMTERAPEMLIGILGILKAGGAYLPIDTQYPQNRIKYILEDSVVQLVLVQRALKGIIGNICKVVDLDDTNIYTGKKARLVNTNNVSDPAYVIYTSGSTGKPKGVIVEHCSVVNVLFALFKEYPCGESDGYLLKTSYTFDVSVQELLAWFLKGGRLVILEANAEKDPQRILEVIRCGAVTHINFVPSMFAVFIDILDHHAEEYLPSLKYIFLAGEALPAQMVNRFLEKNIKIKLENIYGPTEATIYSSKYSLQDWNQKDNIPIGKPLWNIKLYILDKNNHLQAIGIPGELCISGLGTARGYLNRPALTREKFTANPFVQGERLYRTGDLARWLPNGDIEFLGRMDHQVKLRGFRVELGEIENRLLKLETIKETFVIVKEDETGDKFLCAYIVFHSTPAPDPMCTIRMARSSELRDYLQKELPYYMVPSCYMFLEEMPLTPGGKVDRKALPLPEFSGSGEKYKPPEDDLEMKLVEIWSELLRVNKDMIGTDTNFFEIGGHSLRATILISRIHKIFKVKVPLLEIFKTPRVKELAKYIKRSYQDEDRRSIPPVEEKEYYPLSSPQKRMYLLNHLKHDTDTSDNVPTAIILEGNLNRQHFEAVMQRIVKRHESLRTSFILVDDIPVQKIHKNMDFKVIYDEGDGREKALEDISIEDIMANFLIPFDLGKPPLFRVGLVRLSKDKHFLIYDIHHIITDGRSIDIFMYEFENFYGDEGRMLPGLRLQYKDFAVWQNQQQHSDFIKKQEEYWIKVFSGKIPRLNMPLDFPRPPKQQFEGDTIEFELDNDLTGKIKASAAKVGATLYIILLSLFNILLSKYSGQEDIVVGTSISGRTLADLDDIIGFFVNTLAMRNYPGGEKSFRDFLEEVKYNALDAYENQDYQFDDLVKRLGINRELNRSPLFDFHFTVQNSDIKRRAIDEKIGNLILKVYPFDPKSTQFDIIVHAYDADDVISFTLRYCKKLFKRASIEKFIADFQVIASEILENISIKLKDIKISHGLYDKKLAIPDSDFSFQESGNVLFSK